MVGRPAVVTPPPILPPDPNAVAATPIPGAPSGSGITAPALLSARNVVPMGGGLSDLGETVKPKQQQTLREAPAPAGGPSARSVARRRKFAEGVMGNAMDASPTVSGNILEPLLRNVVPGAIGGWMEHQANQEQAAGEARAAEAYKALSAGGRTPSTQEIADFIANQEFASEGQMKAAGMLAKGDDWISVGDGRVFNKTTGEFKSAFGSGGGADPKVLMQFRNDFQNSAGIKNYNGIAPSVNSVYKSINDNSPQANNDFLYGAAKVFDPSTGVKEGEINNILGGMTPQQWMQMWTNKVLNGEGIPRDVKMQIYNVMRRRAGEVYNQAQAEAEQMYKIGPRYGVTPEDLPPLMPLPPADSGAAPAPKKRMIKLPDGTSVPVED